MTKNLSAMRHRELCRTDFDLDAESEASVMSHTVLCRHAGWRSLEESDEVFSCSCATTQLLSKVTYEKKSKRFFSHDTFRYFFLC